MRLFSSGLFEYHVPIHISLRKIICYIIIFFNTTPLFTPDVLEYCIIVTNTDNNRDTLGHCNDAELRSFVMVAWQRTCWSTSIAKGRIFHDGWVVTHEAPCRNGSGFPASPSRVAG